MSRDRERDDDVRELRRLLTVPAERDFPAGRRIRREEHLMRSWRTMEEQRTGGRSRRVRQRVALGLAAAAVTAGVMVAVPGGTETAQAFTVEKNPDGTLSIYLREGSLWWGDVAAQDGLDGAPPWSAEGSAKVNNAKHYEQLTAKIRAAGFTAVIEKIPPGKTCRQDRGERLKPEKFGDGKWDYRFVMTHADTYLVSEIPSPFMSKGSDTKQARFFNDAFIKGPVKPCTP